MPVVVAMKFLRAIGPFCALILIFSSNLKAQNPVHKIYNHKNGLPSNDVLAISQDNLGYLWFLNGDGITRFDGVSFSHTFLENQFFGRMYKDHKGRVWLYGSAMFRHVDQLKYCHSGELHDYAYNHLLDSFAAIVRSLYVDSNDNLWVGLRTEPGDQRPVFIRISPDGTCKEYYFDTPEKDRTSILMKVEDSYLFATRAPSYQQIESYGLWLVKDSDTVFMDAPPTHELMPFCFNNRLFVVTRWLGIMEITNDSIRNLSSIAGLSFPFAYKDVQSTVLLPSTNNGLLRFNDLQFEREPDLLLKDAHFCSVFQGMDGSYWLGTRDKGLYHVPSLDILAFDSDVGLPNSIISDVQVTDSSLWITYRTGLSEVKLNRDKLSIINYKTTGLLTGSYLFRDSVMLLGAIYDFKIPDEFPYEVLVWPTAKQFQPVSKDEFSFTTGHCVNSWHNAPNSQRENFLVGDFVQTHLRLSKGHFLYSDVGGVKRYIDQVIYPLGLYDTLLKQPVSAIESIGKDWVLMASEHFGLIVMKDSAHIHAVAKEQGLGGNMCKGFGVDADSTIWVVTENGLDHLEYSVRDDTVLFTSLWQFGSALEIPFIDVTHIRLSKDDVWLGFMHSILRVPKSWYRRQELPLAPVIEKVYRSGKRVKTLDALCLAYTSGAIDFEITSPYFTAPEELYFKYRLEDIDTAWKSSTRRILSVEGVPPGQHSLGLVAVSGRGVESPVKTFKFQITPSLWQTIWFRTATVLFILLIAFYYFYRKKRQKDQRQRLIGEIKTYKSTAMRLQMNPHFIYNSLGSIQSFVLREESKVSSKYIAKLARLMRMIFDHNNRELISLKEELEALDLYINLEFLRHDHELKYELSLASELVPESTMVPPMLLQPLVENAIVHGLIPQKGFGLISIKIGPIAGGLHFNISDNGTGVRYSQKKHGNMRRSGGIITADRIALFNQQHQFEGDFRLDEKYKLGTRVSFSLPLILVE